LENFIAILVVVAMNSTDFNSLDKITIKMQKTWPQNMFDEKCRKYFFSIHLGCLLLENLKCHYLYGFELFDHNEKSISNNQ